MPITVIENGSGSVADSKWVVDDHDGSADTRSQEGVTENGITWLHPFPKLNQKKENPPAMIKPATPAPVTT